VFASFPEERFDKSSEIDFVSDFVKELLPTARKQLMREKDEKLTHQITVASDNIAKLAVWDRRLRCKLFEE
jgi:hypothetical protein